MLCFPHEGRCGSFGWPSARSASTSPSLALVLLLPRNSLFPPALEVIIQIGHRRPILGRVCVCVLHCSSQSEGDAVITENFLSQLAHPGHWPGTSRSLPGPPEARAARRRRLRRGRWSRGGWWRLGGWATTDSPLPQVLEQARAHGGLQDAAGRQHARQARQTGSVTLEVAIPGFCGQRAT